ncbi:hypothetical protein EJO83_27045 [Salmonella enterica]|nr:hypothetical protein [Salmonella enterica]
MNIHLRTGYPGIDLLQTHKPGYLISAFIFNNRPVHKQQDDILSEIRRQANLMAKQSPYASGN